MSHPFLVTRRSLLAAGAALAAGPVGFLREAQAAGPSFPAGFLWGAATAGHQVEGNNTTSDLWLLEHLQPTPFAEPSGDACNSLFLWPRDLDLVRQIGLNCYRFSLEWARIEPEPGLFSTALLDHYRSMIDGCRERGLTPLVTFNHFTAPRWFAAQGGWTSPSAPDRFARFCERAARHLAGDIGRAMTLNEPNLLQLLPTLPLPPAMWEASKAALSAAARASDTGRFVSAIVATPEDMAVMTPNLIAGHRAGRDAIKSVRPDLPVGVTLAVVDDQAVGERSLREAKRAEIYGAWLEAAKGDDFIGVQNYERARWNAEGRMPPPPDSKRNDMGGEVYAPSLAGAVRYVHAATGLPIVVTEHGVGTDDDTLRAELIPDALFHLKAAIDDGVPVQGYVHWSLLDNFEWVFGYRRRFGLVAVDRATFERTPKPSAAVLGAIARRNAL